MLLQDTNLYMHVPSEREGWWINSLFSRIRYLGCPFRYRLIGAHYVRLRLNEPNSYTPSYSTAIVNPCVISPEDFLKLVPYLGVKACLTPEECLYEMDKEKNYFFNNTIMSPDGDTLIKIPLTTKVEPPKYDQ